MSESSKSFPKKKYREKFFNLIGDTFVYICDEILAKNLNKDIVAEYDHDELMDFSLNQVCENDFQKDTIAKAICDKYNLNIKEFVPNYDLPIFVMVIKIANHKVFSNGFFK